MGSTKLQVKRFEHIIRKKQNKKHGKIVAMYCGKQGVKNIQINPFKFGLVQLCIRGAQTVSDGSRRHRNKTTAQTRGWLTPMIFHLQKRSSTLQHVKS